MEAVAVPTSSNGSLGTATALIESITSLHLLFFPRVHVSCKRRVGGGIEETIMENPAYRPEWQVSHQDVDIEYEDGLSSCCSAKVYAEYLICKDCGDHCEVVKSK